VRNSNDDGWLLVHARRRNAEIKWRGICHKGPGPERFPRGVETGAQIMGRKIASVAVWDIDKGYLRKIQ